MKVKNLGWIVAAALIAVAATAGFQGPTTKIGVVDLTQVFNDSEFAKTQVEALKQVAEARQGMLQFVDTYRTFTPEQAKNFHDLSLKPVPTTAEKAELETIKADVQKADKRLKELQTKNPLTPAESQEMTDLSRRVNTTSDTAQRWSNDARDEVEKKRGDLQKETLDKVRAAVQFVAKAQDYTIVFVTDVAPYGSNNLTAPALAQMNKTK